MSRNKDIKALHQITGYNYSVCRKMLKNSKWRLDNALCLYYNNLYGSIMSTLDFSPLVKAINEFGDAALRCVNTFKEAIVAAVNPSNLLDTAELYGLITGEVNK